MGKETALLQAVTEALGKDHSMAQMNETGRCVSAGFVVEAHCDPEAARVSYRWVTASSEEDERGRRSGTEAMIYNYITTLKSAGFAATAHTGPHSNKMFLKVTKK